MLLILLSLKVCNKEIPPINLAISSVAIKVDIEKKEGWKECDKLC